MVLVTAFEPFDGSGLNSSLEALTAYLGAAAPADLVSCVLPVAFGKDVAALRPALDRHRPDFLLHLGQGHGDAIQIERIAVNLRRDQGASALQPILPYGPPAYLSTIDPRALIAAVNAAGVPARESAHAGTYLCNHVLYRSLHHAANDGSRRRVGFLHLPPLPEQAERLGRDLPTMDLASLSAAVGAAIEALLGTASAPLEQSPA